MYKKRFAVLVLALALCLALPTEAAAARQIAPATYESPMVTYAGGSVIGGIVYGLPVTGDRANCIVSVSCATSIDVISIEITFQRRPSSNLGTPWEFYDNHFVIDYGDELYTSKAVTMEKGYQYHAYVQVTAYTISGSSLRQMGYFADYTDAYFYR